MYQQFFSVLANDLLGQLIYPDLYTEYNLLTQNSMVFKLKKVDLKVGFFLKLNFIWYMYV